MYKFFLKNKLSDNTTSFTTMFASSTNEYTFNNIASLVKVCYKEYSEGIESDPEWEEKNPDWNKVVLIPVSTTLQSQKDPTTGQDIVKIVKIAHDISISSVRLRGGTEYEIPIEVITSKFND